MTKELHLHQALKAASYAATAVADQQFSDRHAGDKMSLGFARKHLKQCSESLDAYEQSVVENRLLELTQ